MRVAACPDEMKVQISCYCSCFCMFSLARNDQAAWCLAQEGDASSYLPMLGLPEGFITWKKKISPNSKSYFTLKAGRKEASQAELSVPFFFCPCWKLREVSFKGKEPLYFIWGEMAVLWLLEKFCFLAGEQILTGSGILCKTLADEQIMTANVILCRTRSFQTFKYIFTYIRKTYKIFVFFFFLSRLNFLNYWQKINTKFFNLHLNCQIPPSLIRS